MKETTLELKNALKFYVSGQEITLALQNVTVNFQTGEFVAITGESGSGKSTLAHVLAGIFPCDQGELLINGSSMEQNTEAEWESYRRDYISFVAQNYGILPGNTVMENVISALMLSGIPKKEAKQRAAYLLKQVDLWKLRRRRAGKLSSGQKQRLSVARAVAKPAQVLVADEPTSNLDWGTASKIIKLLHEASKERLVIMVTHNFHQVEEYATRHIVMRDGEIIEDTSLVTEVSGETQGEAVDAPEKQVHKSKHTAFRNGRYVAGLQLKARPVWTVLMTLCFILTAFAVFAFLGSFFVALDDTGTRRYSTSAFLNGVDTRLIVMKADDTYLTEEDYEKLLTVPWVSHIEKYGIVSDINYHYREGVDYSYSIIAEGDPMVEELIYLRETVLGNSDTYLQTIPVMREGEEFLKAGRLPKHMDEVVAVGSVKLVGTTVDVYFQDRNNWANDVWHKETMTIVGVTDIGEGLYFDDRIGISFWQTWECRELLKQNFGGYAMYYFVNEAAATQNVYMKVVAEDGTESFELQEIDNFLLTPDFIRGPRYSLPTGLISLKDGETKLSMDATVASSLETNLTFYVGVKEEIFDELAFEPYCNQASVFLQDYAYAERAMEAIEELGYYALSPYKIGSQVQDDALANERMTTLVLCLMALFVALVAQVVVLSAMFGTQMANYRELRNIGLSCRVGQLSLWGQVILLTVLGQLAGGALIFFGADYDVAYLVNLVKYLTPLYTVILCLVHLAGSVLLAMTVSLILRTKVFPFIPKGSEIDLSELEEEGERSRA